MGNKGIRCRLADARPRLEMAFEIVGMKLDQPRRQKITVAVNRACRNIRTAVDRGNDSAGYAHPAGEDSVIGNEPRIRKTIVAGHFSFPDAA